MTEVLDMTLADFIRRAAALAADAGGRFRLPYRAAEADSPIRYAWRIDEVVKLLGIPDKAVRELIRSGRLGHVRAGTRYLVPDAEIHRFLAAGVLKRAQA